MVGLAQLVFGLIPYSTKLLTVENFRARLVPKCKHFVGEDVSVLTALHSKSATIKVIGR